MSSFRTLGVFLLLITIVATFASPGEGADANRPRNVGYKIIELKYVNQGREQSITVAVWYPTIASPKPFTYCGPASGTVAVDGALDAAGGPYPLMVFSHGYGGTGIGSVFFTEALAARGWIVAAPDHNDRYSIARIRTGLVEGFDGRSFMQHAKTIGDSGPDDRDAYRYRIEEMKAALEGILASDFFGKNIDTNKIAVGGHSFGGFTALGLCGTIPAYRDSRIRAVLLFSPGAGGYLFHENELARVKIPSMFIFGEREREQKRGNKTMAELADKVYRNLPSPKYLLEIRGANHFSFVNRIKDTMLSTFMSGTRVQFDVINAYSFAFLQKFTAGGKDGDAALEKKDPMLSRYLVEAR